MMRSPRRKLAARGAGAAWLVGVLLISVQGAARGAEAVTNAPVVANEQPSASIDVLAKQVLFGDESRSQLVAGINAVADAVKVTLGPYVCRRNLLQPVAQ